MQQGNNIIDKYKTWLRLEKSLSANSIKAYLNDLDKLIRFIGFALIPIGAALFYNELMVQENAFADAVPAVVAALIGMIPEGLYLLTSVALAVSVMRLAQRKTLVSKYAKIWALTSSDCPFRI